MIFVRYTHIPVLEFFYQSIQGFHNLQNAQKCSRFYASKKYPQHKWSPANENWSNSCIQLWYYKILNQCPNVIRNIKLKHFEVIRFWGPFKSREEMDFRHFLLHRQLPTHLRSFFMYPCRKIGLPLKVHFLQKLVKWTICKQIAHVCELSLYIWN